MILKYVLAALFGVYFATASIALADEDVSGKQDAALTSEVSFDKRLSSYEYPYPVEIFSFSSQGFDLEMAYVYLKTDAPEPKGTVTLLHGKNFNAAYWQDTAFYLQQSGYNVLMPDQIGFGKSSKPTDYQFSFEALAHNTQGLLAHLDISETILMGHSMGGMLASRYALLYPENVQKLVLLNPIGLENYLHYVAYKDVDFFYQNELKASPEKIVVYQQKNYYDGQWNDTYASLTTPLIGWINGSDYDVIAKVSARTYDMIFTGPVIEEFDEFKMPVTLILGTRDRTGPGRGWKKDGVTRELGRYDRLGAEVQQRNKAINVIELEGIGHLPHIESFEKFKGALSQALLFE